MKSNYPICFDSVSSHFLQILIIIWVSLTSSNFCRAQNVDSLKSLLDNEFGHNRQVVLFELAYYYTDIDNDIAMNYINQATKLNEVCGDSLMIVKCGRLKALLYRRFDKMDSSLFLAERVLPIAERHEFHYEIRKLLNGLALVYTYNSSYDRALNSYNRILDLFEPDEDMAEASTIFNNIGFVYFKLEDMKKALFYFEKSLALKEAINNTFDFDKVLVNISSCQAYLKNYPAAKKYNDRARSLCEGSCSKEIIARFEINLGLISQGYGQHSEAAEHFKSSYSLAKETNDSRLQIDNLILLFNLYNETENLAALRILLSEAERIISSNSFYKLGVIQLSKQLAVAYRKLRDNQMVTFYQTKYINLKDSIYNKKLTSNLMNVEAAFLERENRARLKAQERVLELSKDIITRQKTLNIVAIVVAILSVGFVILLIQNVRQKRRINSLLESKVKERTIELEIKHGLLLKSMRERDIQVQRISNEIRSSLATIKGLGTLVSHDLGTVNALSYLAKIEETSNNLIQGLNRVHDQQSL